MKECQDRDLSARKLLHTTVFTQCFSPCGKYLVAANNFGCVTVYSLVVALSPEASELSRQPVYSFKASDSAIHSLVSTDTLLISGGVGDICAWRWTDILNKSAKVIWTIKIPRLKAFSNPEVNSLVLHEEESLCHLYGGCGDNNVYVWNMETGQETLMFRGHKDYIHSVALKNSGRECVSASEDGSVRIWDCRTGGEAMHIIEPFKNEDTVRPGMGKWVGCVAVDPADDWLVCGGGPRLSSWHLRSMKAMSVFNTPAACQNHVMFHDDILISGGSEAYVNHWFMNGELKSKVPCTPTTVFNIVINTKSVANKVLCVAGSNPKIDVCTNFGYKAFSVISNVI